MVAARRLSLARKNRSIAPMLENLESRTLLSGTVGLLAVTTPTVGVVASRPLASETNPATTGAGRFTLLRNGPLTDPLTVNYTVTGTATSGADFAALSGTATFDPGKASAPVAVTPVDDNIAESNETVILTIDAAGGGEYVVSGFRPSATVTIRDNAPTVSVRAVKPLGAEFNGAAPAGQIRFLVTRSGPFTNPLTVNYSLAGTATEGADYTALAGSVTFGAGQASAIVTVTPLTDALAEGTETVILTLDPDAGPSYKISATRDTATGFIRDAQPVVALFVTRDASEFNPDRGGTAIVRVVRTGQDLSQPLTINYVVTGTATEGTDFVALPGSVTIPAGRTSTTFDATPIADVLTEGTETIIITPTPDASFSLDPVVARQTAVIDITDASPLDFLTGTGFNVDGASYSYFATSPINLINGSTLDVTDLTNGVFEAAITATGPSGFSDTRTYQFMDDGSNVFLLGRGVTYQGVAGTLVSTDLVLTPSILTAGSFNSSAPTTLNLGVNGFGTGSTTSRTTFAGRQTVATPLGFFSASRVDIQLSTNLNVTFDAGAGGGAQLGTFVQNEHLTLWVVPGIGVVRYTDVVNSTETLGANFPTSTAINYTASLFAYTIP